MFIPTLKNQCNEEQQKLFYERAIRNEIIGCYAQTEVIIIYIYVILNYIDGATTKSDKIE